MSKFLLIRLISYLTIFITYLFFMSIFSPLGVDWLDWHAQRLFNTVEFLKITGYFNSYGFSIWTICEDCNLNGPEWKNKIYISQTRIYLIPYIIINHLFGKEIFIIIGNILDKSIIFFIGVIIAEIFFKIIKNETIIHKFLLSIFCFTLFIFSPWVYKMIISSWAEIHFLFYFLISLSLFHYKKIKSGLVLLFLSGITNHMWTFLIGTYFLILNFYSKNKKKNFLIKYSFLNKNNIKLKNLFIIILFLPTLIFLILNILVKNKYVFSEGSNLLNRIGISGDDIHNGGIIGSLQFLGGNRITRCFENININNLTDTIFSFNCLLSTVGMFLLSLISIFGFILAIKKQNYLKKYLSSLSFAFLVTICVLQQTMSAHLMGITIVFSIIFSIGLTYYFLWFKNLFKEKTLNLFFLSPIAFAILILCIRVNMLTGPNG